MQCKYQIFNGIRFREETKNGYYIYNGRGENVRMHRYVWEYYNGPIPDGYEIHHIDGNKGNNDISNLKLITAHEHKKYHGENLSDECREFRHNNMITKALPVAIEWHKSSEGREWHKEHIRQQHQDGVFTRELICTQCGNKYVGHINKIGGNTFCSNKCKSAFRRASKVDCTETTCVICGKIFMTNKIRPAKTCSPSCSNYLKWRNRKNENKISEENK